MLSGIGEIISLMTRAAKTRRTALQPKAAWPCSFRVTARSAGNRAPLWAIDYFASDAEPFSLSILLAMTLTGKCRDESPTCLPAPCLALADAR